MFISSKRARPSSNSVPAPVVGSEHLSFALSFLEEWEFLRIPFGGRVFEFLDIFMNTFVLFSNLAMP